MSFKQTIIALLISFCLPLWAQRIVSLSPSLTESVCALGLCDQLVGVTQHCIFPAQVTGLPKVGGYIEPNLEIILSLKPDLVLGVPEHRDVAGKIRQLGIKVVLLQNYNLEDIHACLKQIGELTKQPEAAKALNQQLLDQERALTRDATTGPKCLLVLGHLAAPSTITEIYAVGQQGFLNDILKLVGGQNACPPSQAHYPRFDQENLIRLNPDIIIELVPDGEDTPAFRKARFASWQSVPHLKAVKEERFYLITGDQVLLAGPRYIETAARLAEILAKP